MFGQWQVRRLGNLVMGIVMVSLLGGCADEAGRDPQGFMAIHASADGKGWKGPIRTSMDIAMSDAEVYARKHRIQGDEMMVLAVPRGASIPEQMPPNPLARRELEKPISLESLAGYWVLTDTSPDANDAHYFLDVRPDGTCTTDFGARFVDTPVSEPDTVRVLNESSFNMALAQGENYTFAVTRFDGKSMDALIDGWADQPMRLERADRPTNGPAGPSCP